MAVTMSRGVPPRASVTTAPTAMQASTIQSAGSQRRSPHGSFTSALLG